MIVTLPWPDKRLNPNARVHHMKLSSVKKKAKAEAYYTCVEQLTRAGSRPHLPAEGPIPVKLTFYPPDRRARDDDNTVAMMKAGLDGIAEYLRVNDSRFKLEHSWGETGKPGKVSVEISDD